VHAIRLTRFRPMLLGGVGASRRGPRGGQPDGSQSMARGARRWSTKRARAAPPFVRRRPVAALRVRPAGWKWFLVALLLTAALVPLPGWGQAMQVGPTFRHLTIADGLSQNAVAAVLQDRRGFMWFGTKDGLNRYDGYDFLIFRHDPLDPASLSDSDITALFEDRDGRLWVGTGNGGLNRFDRDRESFHRHGSGFGAAVSAIAQDAAGDLWVGTDGAGLIRLRRDQMGRADAEWERFTHDTGDPASLGHDRVHALLVDRHGALWAGTRAGLDRLDAGSRGFTRYTSQPGSPVQLIDRSIFALLEDDEGRLWMGSTPGISVLDADRTGIRHHYHRYRTVRYGWGEAIEMLQDRTGRLWVSTHAELMHFDPRSGAFQYLHHEPGDLTSSLPTALYQDRSEVIWMGTNGYGIAIHDPKGERFRTFRRPNTRSYRESGFSVYTLFEDSGGNVWINAGLLYRWNRGTSEFVSYESDRHDDFGNTGVWSLLEHPRGFLWAGTYRGLYHHEIATGRSRQYRHDPADPDGLPEEQVKGVFRDRDGTLWAVTENYLAKLVDPVAGRFVSYAYNERPTSTAWTFPSLVQTGDGDLWFGSLQGLVRFDPRTAAIRHYRNDPGTSTSLGHDRVLTVLRDPLQPDRILWVGTGGGGLNRLDIEAGTFFRYTTAHGLPNNVVYGILPDDAGRLWLSTNRGLARFDPGTGEVRSFDATDGLQSNEFNSGAAFRSSSGELFFGGIYGFSHFRPEDVRDNPHLAEVVITGLRRLNRREAVGAEGSILERSIVETTSLRIPARDNVLIFEFAALDYSAPDKNRYAYRMVGFNDTWIDAGAVRSATYTNLPPGSYIFQVRGSNNDGVWNETGASLHLRVLPPWWRSFWAYALYLLLSAGLLLGVRRYEMNRIRLRHRAEQEAAQAERLRQLDHARGRFFANVSHEFRTPLTLTLGPLDDLQAGFHGPLGPALAEQVNLARRNAGRVLELIDQLLEVARLEAGSTPLRARRLELGAFVATLSEAFHPLAARRSVALDLAVPQEPLMVFADPAHLERVVGNLLANAFKFTRSGGTVQLTLEAAPGAARISVRDDGPGISAADLPHIFDRFYRGNEATGQHQPGTGIGLALARELVALHGGKLEVESEEGFGSTFTVSLLLGRDHLAPGQVVDDGPLEGWTPRHPLPLTPADELPAGDAADFAEDGVPEDVTTVLVVEDNAELRAFIRMHLHGRFRVVEAADGLQGLELARRVLPDLVLSDVMMPGLDGYALCRTLKEDPETDFIPVILLTARAATEDRLTGLREAADAYLTKPFQVEELTAQIDNLIALRRRLRERYAGKLVRMRPAPLEVESAEAKFLDQVRGVIEIHLADEEFGVEKLARLVAHSRSHLHRRLKEIGGESPSDLLRRMRLERAAQLLEAGAGSVAEIAYGVGFKSVAHFSNRFQEHFGVRPSAYRHEQVR
jgi:signal transduction histidine kinase/ligand-binding sensor domain-containing protein/DNA-binding response OmpR family regulator